MMNKKSRYEMIVELGNEQLIERIVKSGNENEILELAKAGCTTKALVDWAFYNNKDRVLDLIIIEGHVEDRFVFDYEGTSKRYIPAVTDKYDEYFLYNSDPSLRGALAAAGRHHDELVLDEDQGVRVSVAKAVKDRKIAEILLKDDNAAVKYYLSKSGFCDEVFINDPNPNARKRVAASTKDEGILNTLTFDPDYSVRVEVALRGFNHNLLILDNDFRVRRAVIDRTGDTDLLKSVIVDPCENDFVKDCAKDRLKFLHDNDLY